MSDWVGYMSVIITLLPLSGAPVRSSLLIYSSNSSGSPGKDHRWMGVGIWANWKGMDNMCMEIFAHLQVTYEMEDVIV